MNGGERRWRMEGDIGYGRVGVLDEKFAEGAAKVESLEDGVCVAVEKTRSA